MADNIKPDGEERRFPSKKTRLDYRGRVYIPIEVRRTLQLKPDNEIDLKCESNLIILSPVRKRTQPEKSSSQTA